MLEPDLAGTLRPQTKKMGIGMEPPLDRGELLNLGKNIQGMTIICREGILWATQENDLRDFILRRGRQLRSSGQRPSANQGNTLVPSAALVKGIDDATIRCAGCCHGIERQLRRNIC